MKMRSVADYNNGDDDRRYGSYYGKLMTTKTKLNISKDTISKIGVGIVAVALLL